MFRLLLTGLTLYQVIGVLQSNDCYILSLVCKDDPKCPDDRMFFDHCMKRDAAAVAVVADGVRDKISWADRDNPDRPATGSRRIDYNDDNNNNNQGFRIYEDHTANTLQNLKKIYNDYERESIRESLVLLKNKLDAQKERSDAQKERSYAQKERSDAQKRGTNTEQREYVGEDVSNGVADQDATGNKIRSSSSSSSSPDSSNTDDQGRRHDSVYTRVHRGMIYDEPVLDMSKRSETSNTETDLPRDDNVNVEAGVRGVGVGRGDGLNFDTKEARTIMTIINKDTLDTKTNDESIKTLQTNDDDTSHSLLKQNDDTPSKPESSDSLNTDATEEKRDHSAGGSKVEGAADSVHSIVSHRLPDNSSFKEKKSKIINKAFYLVQSLIKERDTNLNDIILPPVPDQMVSEKFKRKDPPPSNSFVSDVVTSERQKSDDINPGRDRSEVAVPVYAARSEDVMKTHGEKRDDANEDRGLLIIKTSDTLSDKNAVKIGKLIQSLLWNISKHNVLRFQSVENENDAVYRMKINTSWFGFDDNAVLVAKKINTDDAIRSDLNKDSGAVILSAETTAEDTYSEEHGRDQQRKSWDQLTLFSAIIAASVLGLLFAAIVVCIIKRRGKSLTPLIFKRQEAVQDYQELCRTQMSVANSPRPDDESDKNGTMKTWNDEQNPYNMDITTGHVILAYMEDHLKNENRLNKEWEALCSYKADENETLAGSDIKHATKNRYRDVLPYDHTRVKLRTSSNAFHSDYINASFITDTDPKNPSYIATQGPLDNTVADFWQMIWEQGVVVIINLTKLSDMGLPQCHHYWPLDGSEVYHIYEVHLISEHIWCDDYLVRSLYLKNLQTGETRTVTQFHYLTWPDLSIPTSPKPLLEFRRKVNKCYRGHACPVVVHCNNGVGRTGTYILLDMVLNKMIKGTKEIDIAATLEHLRDQRQDVVKTKGQFEFALLAVAEEVTAILTSVAR